jgi:hypothetical protein
MTTSVGIIIPNTTVPGTGWPKRYKDASIDDATIYCYDFSNPESWPSQANATAGQSVQDLSPDNADGAISAALTFSNGGLNFTVGSTSQRIALPDAAKLGADTDDFLFAQWVTGGTQTQAVFELGGYHYLDTGPYGIRATSGTSMRLICGGNTNNVTLTAGQVTAFHIAREKVDEGEYLAHFFRNGALTSTQVQSGDLQQPSTAVAVAALGDAAGTGYSGFYIGRINRSWLTTKHRSLAQIQEAVSRDWEMNAGYFA